MAIEDAIIRAYRTAHDRNWNTVYWAVDLHGTVLKSNYANDSFEFINDSARTALQLLSKLPETRIIIWSSIFAGDADRVRRLFADNNIRVDYVNENPEVTNTLVGNFSSKFYFSVLIDDKAGFIPDEWSTVETSVVTARNKYPI